MKKNIRVIGTPSADASSGGSASRRSNNATVPESRPSVMRALGCGRAKPPPTGAIVTPPFARSRWPSSWRTGGVAPGRAVTMRSNTSGTSAADTSRQMPPARSNGSEPQTGSECGCLRCQEACPCSEPARRRPLRHLRAIEQKPAPVRCVRQAFVADPAFHDFLRDSKRLGDLDKIQVHDLLKSVAAV